MDARGQASNIIIDARGQAGMTPEVADRAIERALGADFKKKIESITILAKDGISHVTRGK